VVALFTQLQQEMGVVQHFHQLHQLVVATQVAITHLHLLQDQTVLAVAVGIQLYQLMGRQEQQDKVTLEEHLTLIILVVVEVVLVKQEEAVAL
jgi:hypothetical protein